MRINGCKPLATLPVRLNTRGKLLTPAPVFHSSSPSSLELVASSSSTPIVSPKSTVDTVTSSGCFNFQALVQVLGGNGILFVSPVSPQTPVDFLLLPLPLLYSTPPNCWCNCPLPSCSLHWGFFFFSFLFSQTSTLRSNCGHSFAPHTLSPSRPFPLYLCRVARVALYSMYHWLILEVSRR